MVQIMMDGMMFDLASRLAHAPRRRELLQGARDDFDPGHLPTLDVWIWWVQALEIYEADPSEATAQEILDGSIILPGGDTPLIGSGGW